jgi:putative restriction endonuclease
LLVALLLARYIKSGQTKVTFREVEAELTELIGQFSPSASRPRAIYPFWRLQTDGFWCIEGADQVLLGSSGDPNAGALDDQHPGRWTPDAIEGLKHGAAQEVLGALLNKYFAAPDREALRTYLGVG